MGEPIEIDFIKQLELWRAILPIMGIESTKTTRCSGNIGTSTC
jgi:hypothetical protein